MASLFEQLSERIRNEQAVGLATIIDGPGVGCRLLIVDDDQDSSTAESPREPDQAAPLLDARGTLGNPELDRIVRRDALGELEAGRSGIRHYGPTGQTTPEDLEGTPVVKVFIETWAPPPQMWIFGAVDFTAALARAAKLLGYRVTVCDAREIFATSRRFPMADEVIVTWPTPVFASRGHVLGSRDVVCVLTHDAKFDVPAIVGALQTRVGYIGVMGSRHTHTKRLQRLAEVGVDQPAQLDRLMSPIGLDIGARTPEETAISICAEIIARRTGRKVPSLRDSSGTIHGQ